jgi:hypothetical protein
VEFSSENLFRSQSELRRHKQDLHGIKEELFKCEICLKGFIDKATVQKHFRALLSAATASNHLTIKKFCVATFNKSMTK